MSLTKPYKRIWRPLLKGSHFLVRTGLLDDNNQIDQSVAPDFRELIRAYHLLEKDVIRLFDYIEPHDKNNLTFSHIIYALFLRSCTEFENNCKAILKTNAYSTTRNLRINDYCKIDKATKLSDYEVRFDAWEPSGLSFRPYNEWKSSHSLGWYQSYNEVKHDRSKNFEKANLKNLMLALAGVYSILFSQFTTYVGNAYQFPVMTGHVDEDSFSDGNSIFSILVPSWQDSEKYDFDWDTIKTDPQRFVDFPF